MAIRIQVEWTGLAGSPYLSTFYGPGAGQEQATIARDVVEDVLSTLTNAVSDSLTARVLPEAVDYSTPDTPVDTYPVEPASRTMGATGKDVSRATQGLIRLRTSTFVGARRVQGRIFVPGVTDLAIATTGGVPQASYRTLLDSAGAQLVAANFQIASRATNQFVSIESATAWTQFAVLRSRRD